RSDAFSFGCVLYEMLTGRQAFQGDTVSEILASVLVREPDYTVLPANLNPRLHELLKRCFQKNPKRRWQAVGDLRAELEAVAAAPPDLPAIQQPSIKRPLWKLLVPLLATAVVFSAIAGFVGWKLKPPATQPITRFPLVLPEAQQFLTADASHALAVSRDGSRL